MTSYTLQPTRPLTDEEIFSLAKTAPQDYGRFVVNELQARGSHLLQEHASAFLDHATTRIPALIALGRTEEVAKVGGRISTDEISAVIEAKQTHGADTQQLYDSMVKDQTLLRANIPLNRRLQTLFADRSWPFSGPVDELNARSASKACVLVGITKVKDEGLLVPELLSHMLQFCDHVVISDGSSEPIAEAVDKDFGSQVTVIAQEQPFDESKLYPSLWAEALRQGATHLMHMDADERLCEACQPSDLRDVIMRLNGGESLAVPWWQIIRSHGLKRLNFEAFNRFSLPRLLPQYKDLVIAVSGSESRHLDFPLHNPWTPMGEPTNRFFADEVQLLHLDSLDLGFWVNKYNRYFFWDFALNGSLPDVLRRYMPLYFRNARVAGPDSENYLVPWQGNLPEVYEKEFARRGAAPRSNPFSVDDRAAKLFELFSFQAVPA